LKFHFPHWEGPVEKRGRGCEVVLRKCGHI
jgi:hypothetical protein